MTHPTGTSAAERTGSRLCFDGHVLRGFLHVEDDSESGWLGGLRVLVVGVEEHTVSYRLIVLNYLVSWASYPEAVVS